MKNYNIENRFKVDEKGKVITKDGEVIPTFQDMIDIVKMYVGEKKRSELGKNLDTVKMKFTGVPNLWKKIPYEKDKCGRTIYYKFDEKLQEFAPALKQEFIEGIESGKYNQNELLNSISKEFCALDIYEKEDSIAIRDREKTKALTEFILDNTIKKLDILIGDSEKNTPGKKQGGSINLKTTDAEKFEMNIVKPEFFDEYNNLPASLAEYQGAFIKIPVRNFKGDNKTIYIADENFNPITNLQFVFPVGVSILKNGEIYQILVEDINSQHPVVRRLVEPYSTENAKRKRLVKSGPSASSRIFTILLYNTVKQRTSLPLEMWDLPYKEDMLFAELSNFNYCQYDSLKNAVYGVLKLGSVIKSNYPEIENIRKGFPFTLSTLLNYRVTTKKYGNTSIFQAFKELMNEEEREADFFNFSSLMKFISNSNSVKELLEQAQTPLSSQETRKPRSKKYQERPKTSYYCSKRGYFVPNNEENYMSLYKLIYEFTIDEYKKINNNKTPINLQDFLFNNIATLFINFIKRS